MRCARCGNENPDSNRFCGMCGASLLSPSAPRTAQSQPVAVAAPAPKAEAAAAPSPSPVSEPPRSPAPVREISPSISGPSFLGLNDPAPGTSAPRKRASLSIDPHSAPGSNLEYLLDEEEPSHHWGIGKILFILIALALAVGFGYLRWKGQGLASLNLLPKKPAAVAQSSPPPDTTAQPPSSTNVEPDSQPAAAHPAASTPQPSPTTPASTVPNGAAAANPAPPASTPATSTADTPKSDDAVPRPDNPDTTAAPADKDTAAADKADAAAPPTKPAEKPKPAPKPPLPKPSAASKPASSYDPVTEAQKYLYGRGATQDCERGLRLLKPAANQANPKAMVEMGALYSAGLCTPHDLPTAYRWFALALRKDPENTAVQADLQKLWGEMTQPERQLAIKLSQ